MAKNEKLSAEVLNEFCQFLMGGRIPGGITMKHRPRKMTAKQAMSVIYVLQEFVGVISDRFEMCDACNWIYDTEQEGHTGTDGEFSCANCSHSCQCTDCKRLLLEDK